MKDRNLLFILVCTIFIALATGCESTDIQKSSFNNKEKIAQRDDDCDCPNVDDCCCAVSLSGVTELADLLLCGTTDGDETFCEVPDPGVTCEEISGLGHSSFVLEVGVETREFFCMLMERGFMIRNNGNSTVTLTISCQSGQTNAQSLNITLVSHGRKYFQTNDECEITECE